MQNMLQMGANDRPLALVPVAEAIFRALGMDRGRHRLELIAVDGHLVEGWMHPEHPKLTRREFDLVELHPRDEAA